MDNNPGPVATLEEITEADLQRRWAEKRSQVNAEKVATTTSPSAPILAADVTTSSARKCIRCKTRPPKDSSFVMGLCIPCDAEVAQDREAQEREALASTRQRDLRANLERIGVNVRKYFDERAAALDTFDPQPDRRALTAVHEFLEKFRRGVRPSLYLFSRRPNERLAPGNGKTHLAVAILRELVLDPAVKVEQLRFVFVPELLLDIQDTFDNPNRSTVEIVRKYTDPELLVWDDIGSEKLSDFAVRTLYTILYKREGRSNVFTSNLSLEEIEDRDSYAERITSRIAGDARVIEMNGPDRRPLLRAV